MVKGCGKVFKRGDRAFAVYVSKAPRSSGVPKDGECTMQCVNTETWRCVWNNSTWAHYCVDCAVKLGYMW